MARLLALATVLSALLLQGSSPLPEPTPGIVLLAVRQGSTCDRAALRPGDVLEGWRQLASTRRQEPEQGLFSTPFEWTEMLLERLPRGDVEVWGLRHGGPRTWILPGGAPAILSDTEARPTLPAGLLERFERGRKSEDAGQLAGAWSSWRSAEALSRTAGKPRISRWFATHIARRALASGRPAMADPLYQRLVDAFATEPGGAAPAAQLLREWAISLREREMWSRAEAADRRALALDLKVSPESLAASWSLTGLGNTALWSAGSQNPDLFFQRALALRERLAPGSADIAISWWDRGNAARGARDPARALCYLRRSVALMEQAVPQSLYVADKLRSLGKAEYATGDFAAAERSWRKALAIAVREAPDDWVTSGLLQGLGDLALKQRRWAEAADFLDRSRALGEKLEMDPIARTDILADLALAERRLGRKAKSSEHYCQAMEIFEAKRKPFTSLPESQMRWGALLSDYYRDCAQALIDQGETGQAFQALERGRARSFLDGVATRERPVKPAGARAAAWQKLDAEYDRIQSELGLLQRHAHGTVEAIYRQEGRMREIQRRKAEMVAATGEVRPTPPLDLEAAAKALDPGTVLLSYVTTREQTLLFVVEPGAGRQPSVAVHTVPASIQELGARIETFRTALIEDRFRIGEIERQGSALYDLLLRPAEPQLARSERLLIVPDGPLHTLPFAALVREGRFLAEWKPIHFATSATVYTELRKRRQPPGDRATAAVLAFGDPWPSGEGARDLAPLPASRREVAGIARLFPGARIFLGRKATEESAKREAGRAEILHFAVHARLDQRMPANSTLVMSPPAAGEPGNGLLQAWEITEGLRLEADLVTLSACGTALGTDMGGEGLVGLTRAFQTAGARSVVATLWEISDGASAALMQRFYAGLRAGKSKDEALREAQEAQLGQPAHNEPFYWASYQLYGDWR